MAFEEDLSVFFADFGSDCVAEFADEAQANYEFEGIFEDPYAATQLGTYRVVISDPTLLVKGTEQIDLLRRNDVVTVDERRYIVTGKPEDDGTGVARVKLVVDTAQDDQSSSLSEDELGLFE